MQHLRKQQSRKQKLTTLMGLVLVFALLNPINNTSAQSSTEVWIDPIDNQILTGETLWLDVKIKGAENVNAFEIELLYDPQIVTLIKYTPGTYLSNLFQVHKLEEPGKIRLAYAQLATQPASGDGVLISFQYQGVAAGTSLITIGELIVADSNSTLSNLIGRHGEIQVNRDNFLSPTPSSTFTITPENFLQPSSTFTPEALMTATKIQSNTLSVPAATATHKTINTSPNILPTASASAANYNAVNEAESKRTQAIKTPVLLESTQENLGINANQQKDDLQGIQGLEQTPEVVADVFVPPIPAGEALLETLKWVVMSFSMGGSLLLVVGFIFRSRK